MGKTKIVYPQPVPIEVEEDEIDLVELWNVVWKRRKFLAVFVLAVTSLVAIYSLLLPNIYRSEVVILPNKARSGMSGLSGLAKMAGLSLPVSSNVAEIKARLNSKMIYARLIEKYHLLPLFFPKDWDEEQKRWKDPEDHPTVENGIRLLKNLVNISEDRKTGAITVAVEFKDPEEAARLAELLVKELRDIMVKDTVERAQKTLRELENSLPKVTDPLVQQKIYALMAKQIETISLAKASESFAFRIIDPPRVPDKKYKPKRTLMVAVAFVSSLFLGIFLIFFKEFLDNVRKSRNHQGGDSNDKKD